MLSDPCDFRCVSTKKLPTTIVFTDNELLFRKSPGFAVSSVSAASNIDQLIQEQGGKCQTTWRRSHKVLELDKAAAAVIDLSDDSS